MNTTEREVKGYRTLETRVLTITQNEDTELLPGESYKYTVPKGTWVLSTDPGIAAPTIHGGGVHRRVTDPQTGYRFSVLTDGWAE